VGEKAEKEKKDKKIVRRNKKRAPNSVEGYGAGGKTKSLYWGEQGGKELVHEQLEKQVKKRGNGV